MSIVKISSFFLLLLICAACKENTLPEAVSYTVLVYMAADNSMNSLENVC